MPYKDPETRKRKAAEYSKKHYEKNKANLLTKAKIYKRKRKADWIEFKKTLSCAKCGETHHATFDFHHIERHPHNRKVNELVRNHNYGGALKEMANCIVLCANCHRKYHHEELISRNKAKKKKTLCPP